MKALICKTLDGPDALDYGDFTAPEIAAGMVLVDVKTASINFPDVLITKGEYQMKPDLPFVPGGEGAGIVAAVGDGVSHVSVGDAVLFTSLSGAFAEQVLVPAMMTVPKPAAMSFEEAAAFTITYGTSYHALKQRANLSAGETVLVLGAAGGVGIATIEIAKAMGATVIAAASSDEKLAVCKEHGADHLINYSKDDLKSALKQLAAGGIDVVYDPVGGAMTEVAFRAMAYNGRHLVIGFAAGDIPKVPANLALLKMCQLVGVFWGNWAMKFPADNAQNMQELFSLFAKGQLKPHVESLYALEDYKEAYACLTKRKVKGKVVFQIGG